MWETSRFVNRLPLLSTLACQAAGAKRAKRGGARNKPSPREKKAKGADCKRKLADDRLFHLSRHGTEGKEIKTGLERSLGAIRINPSKTF